MKTLSHRTIKAVAFLVLVAGLASQACAQLVTYQFTGTQRYGNAGTNICGTITLDVAAASDDLVKWDEYRNYDSWSGYRFRGFNETWFNGGFSIDAVTDIGLTGGTATGGDTYFFAYESIRDEWYYGDYSSWVVSGHGIYHGYDDDISTREVRLYGFDDLAGGVIPGQEVPNPWNPQCKADSGIRISEYNKYTGEYVEGDYSIDTFTLVPSTIVIDGVDTGIDDFQYQGKLVSRHLEAYAAAARNHGDYVNGVAKLTNALVKAGLLTGKQKGIIMDAAARSRYGK